MGRGGKRGSARLGALAAAALIPGAALADVATDGTLGRKVRLTGRQVEVGADLGRVRGGNIFHSFGRFDVPGEGRVTFTGPAGLDNVVARVTGGEPSSIDGTLASRVPGADLYLVNPSGILFGPGARLDVPGSFHASTADELRLQDGTVFSASDPGRGGLSVARPEAFGFLGGRPGAVTLDRGTLEVLAGQALSLVGGNVEVAGGGLRAPGGRLALSAFGGLGEHVIATGEATGDPSANVRLTGRASASTTGDGGGTVLIRGGRLDLEDRSAILAGNTGPSDAPGGIAVEADEVTVGSDSLVATGALAGGAAGPVTVRAGQVELRAGGRLDSVALASGGTGPITVEAARLTVAGEPRPVGRELAPEVRDLLESATAADLGTLLAVARELAAAATDAAPPDAQAVRLTFARGGLAPPAAGDPEPFTGINAVTLGPASAAPVVVRADEIELRDGLVSSDGFGPGSAGPVTVEAGRRLFVDGTGLLPVSGIVSAASGGGAEGAGRVTVRAGHAEVRGGVIGTSPLGQRGGGRVLVEADRLLLGDGGDARAEPRLASVESSAFSDSGRGGNVTVRAGELEIRAGGVVSTGTFSTATGGAVTVEAGRLLIAGDGRLSLAAIASNAVSPSAEAGSVTVNADGSLDLRDGGRIASASLGAGAAGNVRVAVGGTFSVDHARVSTFGRGAEGGRVAVSAGDLILLDAAEITSSGVVPAEGASLIALAAPLIVLLDGSRVTSLTGDGAPLEGSGEARVLGDLTFISADSEVLGSSTVELAGLDNEVGTDLRLSPGAFLDAGALLGGGCAARRAGESSTFTRAGRGGLPPSPDRPLASAGAPERGEAASAEGGRLLVAGPALSRGCDGLDPDGPVR